MSMCMAKVRKTTASDIARVAEIFDAARRYMRLCGNMSQWAGSYPSAGTVADDISSGTSHVIEDDEGRVVATFCLLTEPEPTYKSIRDGAWPDADAPYVTLHRVASDGSIRGVMDIAVAHALKAGVDVRVDTHGDNLPMQLALARMGFVRCGIITLADGSDRTAYCLCRRGRQR